MPRCAASQYATLLLLYGQPGLSGAKRARRALITPQTMSTVLGNLERKGLVDPATHPPTPASSRSGSPPTVPRCCDADRAAIHVEAVLDAALSPDTAKLRQMLVAAADALERHRAAPDSSAVGSQR